MSVKKTALYNIDNTVPSVQLCKARSSMAGGLDLKTKYTKRNRSNGAGSDTQEGHRERL